MFKKNISIFYLFYVSQLIFSQARIAFLGNGFASSKALYIHTIFSSAFIVLQGPSVWASGGTQDSDNQEKCAKFADIYFNTTLPFLRQLHLTLFVNLWPLCADALSLSYKLLIR